MREQIKQEKEKFFNIHAPLPDRSYKNNNLIGFITIGCIVTFIAFAIDTGTGIKALIGCIIILSIIGCMRNDTNNALLQKYQNDIDLLKSFLNNHLKTLYLKKKQLCLKDAYGKVNIKDWEKEKIYFITHHIRDNLKFNDIWACEISDFIEKIIIKKSSDFENEKILYNENISPLEYEKFCADILRGRGWDARTTKGSGDQGIDVIAEKEGIKVIVQCKKHQSPVGNKAVQEVIAGKEYEGADYAIVVSNASYTKSAKQLATKANVLLLHHENLSELSNLIISKY